MRNWEKQASIFARVGVCSFFSLTNVWGCILENQRHEDSGLKNDLILEPLMTIRYLE